jgi:periplasmic divalent cation tolerance protein
MGYSDRHMSDLQPARDAMVALTTIGNADAAQTLADALVGEQLVACCNVMEVRSTYTWKGALCRDPEFMIVMKTRRELLERLTARLRELHPYECPELIAMPLEAGFAGYLAWLRASTGGSEA